MKRFLILIVFAAGAFAGRAQDAPRRPQEPIPPFPYRSEEVAFENTAAGITLAGTLTMPAESENKDENKGFAAVVLLSGSGVQNRDEEIFGHRPFLVLADYLARRGIACLRFDDRGAGGSGGDPATATSADLATDAAAALEYLHTRPEIDHSRTGLAGHSEGAILAFMTAADHPARTAFVISMAGPGVRGDEISVMQLEDIVVARGVPAEAIPSLAAKQRRDLALIIDNSPEVIEANIDSIAALMVPGFALLPDDTKNLARSQIRGSNSPWSRFFMTHDPAEDIEKTKCPVLAIGGDKDLQVRSSVNLVAIGKALEAGGNRGFTAIEYPGLNHLFQTAGTGDPGEYGRIEETFSPQVLEDIADWILKTTR